MVMVVGAGRGQGEKVKNNTETNRPGPEGNEDTRGSACCDCAKDKDKSSIAPGCACWLCCGMRVYGLQDAKIWKQCGQARGLR